MFDHLTDRQIAIAKYKATTRENTFIDDMLSAFPGVIFRFEGEMANAKDPYIEMVREVAKISRGQFNPEKISDNFNRRNKRVATLRFRVNHKRYKARFRKKADSMDFAVLNFVNDVVSKNLRGKFYFFYDGGEDTNAIYLTPTQYEYFRSNNLGNFHDY
jgi:hypothetical protein